MSPLVVAVVTGLLGGGLITAFTGIYTARKKAPVERDSIIVTGAETAVLALEKTLAAETRRADRAEGEAARYRDQVRAMEDKLNALQDALDATRAELTALLHSTD